MKKRHKRFLPLKNILSEVIEDSGMQKGIQQQQVLLYWERIVGKGISKVTNAKRIDNNILFIRVETPVWRQELTFQKIELIQKINIFFKSKIIKDIIFI